MSVSIHVPSCSSCSSLTPKPIQPLASLRKSLETFSLKNVQYVSVYVHYIKTSCTSDEKIQLKYIEMFFFYCYTLSTKCIACCVFSGGVETAQKPPYKT